MVYKQNGKEITINLHELKEAKRDLLTKEEILILELLFHKIKCNQHREAHLEHIK